MSEKDSEAFEMRSRALFQDSVDGLDMRIRSRLTQARSAALEAASESRRPWRSEERRVGKECSS